jgi:hypothetical protein
MNTSEVLNRAADLIEERGWGKGVGWVESDSTICLEGAIWAAQGHSIVSLPPWWEVESCGAGQAIRSYLNLSADCCLPWVDYSKPVDEWLTPTTRLFMWNDHPSRTAEEVIETLRAAAVIEAAKENADARVAVTA